MMVEMSGIGPNSIALGALLKKDCSSELPRISKHFVVDVGLASEVSTLRLICFSSIQTHVTTFPQITDIRRYFDEIGFRNYTRFDGAGATGGFRRTVCAGSWWAQVGCHRRAAAELPRKVPPMSQASPPAAPREPKTAPRRAQRELLGELQSDLTK